MESSPVRSRIHLVIGTKAQLIKTYPIIRELIYQKIPYRYIDTGQHPKITKSLRKAFNIPEPDFFFVKEGENVSGILQAIIWNFRVLFISLFKSSEVFGKESKGICLIHGDTISTLQGLIMAKIAKLDVGHVEAGERTHTLFRPFPEEIIRILVDKFSNVAFASSDRTVENLKKEKFKGELIGLGYNTIVDSVLLAQRQSPVESISLPGNYVLVSIHRFETVKSCKRLEILLSGLEMIAQNFQIVWGLHEPTKKELIKCKLFSRVEKIPNIHLRGLFDYFEFVQAIKNAEFLVTDGGGPQEESWLLNTPCMLMRNETEREEHRNVYKTEFEIEKMRYFAANYKEFKQSSGPEVVSPSIKIVEYLSTQ